ncbi:MAG: DUF58 domain-containing protein [Acidimicrobiia bacterium]
MTTDPTGGRPPRTAPVTTPPYPVPVATREWRPAPPLLGVGALIVLTWMIWARTASRVSLFVCVVGLVAIAVDLLWSRFRAARVAPAVVANPVECRVGDRVHIVVRLDGPRQRAQVSLRSIASRPLDVEVPSTVTFDGIPSGRQVATAVLVEVLGDGVAGLIGVLHRRTVPLLRPLYVGPRPLPAVESFPDLLRTWGEGESRPAPSGDLVRGVRPYVPGDPQRRVHWPASARVGDLVVKEVEDIDAPRILVAVDLGAGGAAGERAAARAAWYAEEALRRGYGVVLATAELARPGDQASSRPVTATVTSSSDVTRRLAAAAAPGKPSLPADTRSGAVLLVTDRGDTWR